MKISVWLLTYQRIDSQPPTITNFEAENKNLKISLKTETESIAQNDILEKIANFMSMVINRRPLPTPDGLVDDSANPITNSKSDAEELVDCVNRESENLARDFQSRLSSLENKESIEQVIQDPKKLEKSRNSEA